MCRDSQGAASGPLGTALDLITREERTDDERRRLPGAVAGVHSEACVVTQRDEGLAAAIKAAGGLRPLARELGMSVQAFSEWKRVPVHRILQVEAVTKIPREKLRPDLYRGEPAE